ncbi:hypothetical protein [Candidatus Clostridium stratigraminis]|uniref:Uncharacterized protein n=1 Tax=Candidatus Clostridium stratigraminis TaxID=3381661 RepID=A0ABW8SYH0_9CLOT
MGGCSYGVSEIQYLEDNWGLISIPTMAKKLNRSVSGILNIKGRLKLGSFLESGEYLTMNQLVRAAGRKGSITFKSKQWMDKGLPYRNKKVLNGSFRVVYLKDFWKWAEEYRMNIDFSKFTENTLGLEPEWVKEQREADIAFAKYKTTPWTEKEDNLLRSYLRLYKYTYKELSLTLLRTEGAIKRRVVDLDIKERPLREDPHGTWSSEQVEVVIKMYQKGYRSEVIKEYIDKSGQAIAGKIERLIRDGLLTKWK